MLEYSKIPDDYLMEIGRVSSHWSHFEMVLQMCMVLVLGKKQNDFRAHAVFIHMSYPQQADVLGAMISGLNPPDGYPSSRYRQEILPLLNDAASRRNAVLHSRWGVIDGVVTRLDVKARGSIKLTQFATSIKDVEDASESILKASRARMGAKAGPRRGQKRKASSTSARPLRGV